MNKLTMSLITVMLLLAGCASKGGLPEIAPYDEPYVEPLPAVVPAAGW